MVRQWKILTALSARRYGASLRELAEETGVSQRTIRRDLALFRQLAFPIEETVAARGRNQWRLTNAARRPPLDFTLTEAIALYLGRRFLEPLAGTYFWDGANSAFRKIRAHCGERALKHIDKMAVAFHQTGVGLSDYSRKGETLDALMLGIEERRVVDLTYRSEQATEAVSYDVYPYGLIRHQGSLYMVAYAPRHKQLRHYKVDRVENANATDLRFPMPADFKLEDHLSGSFGIHHSDDPPTRVRIAFAAEVARYVEEKRWHASQTMTRKRDGSLIVELKLSDLYELKSWILSFGPRAVVLEPAALVEEIEGDLRAALTNYGRGESDGNPALPKTHRLRRAK